MSFSIRLVGLLLKNTHATRDRSTPSGLLVTDSAAGKSLNLNLDKDDRNDNDWVARFILLSRQGALAMFNRLIPVFPGVESSLALMAVPTATRVLVGCMGVPCAGMSGAGAWMAVYRMAYEQARAALEPSRFQKMLNPSSN
jgi:hypothetical protein